jgi:hypothetical protein
MDRLDTKLTKFEESKIDERKQLEVRVSAIEKHFGLDKKIAARPTPSPTSPPTKPASPLPAPARS